MIALRREPVHDVGRPAAPASAPIVEQRPHLTLVPRRRAAGFAATLLALLAATMFGLAVFHTRLAERQLEIDRLAQAVTEAQVRFDVLRNERAELRSPTRLAREAEQLGMAPATGGEFIAVDGWALARSIAATGQGPTEEQVIHDLEPLDQFRLVKNVAGETP